jgi:hypothetical protein
MAFTVSRSGQVNAAGDDKALFLKVFGGEVLTAFRQKTAFAERHKVRQISSGKSAQFPATGRTGVKNHTVGTQLTGSAINHAERVITIDDKLVSDVFIADIDEAMNHYDVRAEYSFQMGEALAQFYDKNVARVGILAARSAGVVTGLPGGTIIEAATAGTDSDVLGASLFSAQQSFDEKDVPEAERWAFVKPAQYYSLAQNTTYINKDYAGAGSIATGVIQMVGGLPIVKTNNLPTADDSANTDINSKYRGDFGTTVALVMQKAAVGTVKLMDLAVESEYLIDYQGTLMVAKYLCGHGILEAPCAAEIRTADPAV